MTRFSVEALARSLLKLERLELRGGTFEQISVFVRNLKNLKTIRILTLPMRNEFFDLFSLNEERKKLKNAAQVTIDLPERIYMNEIWKSKELNLEHVKIARWL